MFLFLVNQYLRLKNNHLIVRINSFSFHLDLGDINKCNNGKSITIKSFAECHILMSQNIMQINQRRMKHAPDNQTICHLAIEVESLS